MHVLVAPDKFKGSLTAAEVAGHIAAGLRRVAGDGVAIACVPVADGGDGTLDAAIAAGFGRVPVRASGPTGEPVDAAYGRRGELAVVELASVCGLGLLPGGRREPLRASSFGMGEVIGAALDAGCERIVLGVGGSASTDGGAGLLEALGARVYDRAGAPLPRGGGALREAGSVDLSGLHPAISRTAFTVASDVDNPLFGPQGAAAVYGPQKGATPEQVVELEARFRADPRLARVASLPGSGAAGGLGAALALLGAELVPGAAAVLDLVGFDASRHALVVTGEGRVDATTGEGKVAAEVARRCAVAGVPCVVFGGLVEAPLPAPAETVALSGDRGRARDDLVELGRRLGLRLLDAPG